MKKELFRDKVHIMVTIDGNNPRSKIEEQKNVILDLYNRFSDVSVVIVIGDCNNIKILYNPYDKSNIQSINNKLMDIMKNEKLNSVYKIRNYIRKLVISNLLNS